MGCYDCSLFLSYFVWYQQYHHSWLEQWFHLKSNGLNLDIFSRYLILFMILKKYLKICTIIEFTAFSFIWSIPAIRFAITYWRPWDTITGCAMKSVRISEAIFFPCFPYSTFRQHWIITFFWPKIGCVKTLFIVFSALLCIFFPKPGWTFCVWQIKNVDVEFLWLTHYINFA